MEAGWLQQVCMEWDSTPLHLDLVRDSRTTAQEIAAEQRAPNRSVLAIIPGLHEVKGNRYAQRRLRSRPQVIRPHVKMVDAGRGDWGLAL